MARSPLAVADSSVPMHKSANRLLIPRTAAGAKNSTASAQLRRPKTDAQSPTERTRSNTSPIPSNRQQLGSCRTEATESGSSRTPSWRIRIGKRQPLAFTGKMPTGWREPPKPRIKSCRSCRTNRPQLSLKTDCPAGLFSPNCQRTKRILLLNFYFVNNTIG